MWLHISHTFYNALSKLKNKTYLQLITGFSQKEIMFVGHSSRLNQGERQELPVGLHNCCL